MSAFIRAFSDLSRFDLCPICVEVILYAVGNASPEEQLQFRASNHELYNACIERLIASPRSSDAILELGKALLANVCTEHRDTTPRPDSRVCIETYIEVSCNLVTSALVIGTTEERSILDRARVSTRFQKRNAKAWPIDIQQLIPRGAQATVEALIFWTSTIPDSTAPISLFNVLLLAHRPLIFPATLLPRIRNDLTWALVRMFGVASDVDAIAFSTLREPLVALLPTTSHSRLISNLEATGKLAVSIQVLAHLNVGPHCGPDDLSRFAAGGEGVIWAGTQAALRHIRCTWESCVCGRSAAIGCLLDMLTHCIRVLMSIPSWTSPSAGLDERVAMAIEAETEAMPRDWGATHIMFSFLRLVNEMTLRCFDDTCNTYKVDARLQRCARCFIVRYCGRDCQRRDWRGDGSNSVAHKDVCPLITRLLPQRRIPDSYSEWEPTYLRDPMCVRELQRLYRWACDSAVIHPSHRVNLEQELSSLTTEDPDAVVLPRPVPFIRSLTRREAQAT
ncbi:hypothetical protein EXIGLDRAFT_837153 [Exidia glandulosa HHB12029]|uniref:MYND-type domain-containing protein n=1 Tax=Exidia glandulosa HHB12029 TaxID=1314781 RepID=A0A165H466_EXIGL|nr:hypothetical protein EXIGLDRAFT_837153 [Exidia glandulosa HHB12029]